MGWIDDINTTVKSNPTVASDPKETGGAAALAQLAPPPGMKALTPADAFQVIQAASDPRASMGGVPTNPAYLAYAQKVVATDKVLASKSTMVTPEQLSQAAGSSTYVPQWLQTTLHYAGIPLAYVKHGLGTAESVMNKAGVPGSGIFLGFPVPGTITDPNAWRNKDNAFDPSKIFQGSTWSDAWDQSKTATPGQILLAPTYGPDTTGMTNQQQAEAWNDWGHNTTVGRLSTGTFDFVESIYLDPTAGLGKASKVTRLAQVTTKAGETEDVLRAAEAASQFGKEGGQLADTLSSRSGALADPGLTKVGGKEGAALADALTEGGTASPRTSKLGAKLHDFIVRTDTLSLPEMLKLKPFQQTADSGILAHLFTDANKIEEPAARWAAKRDILGAAMGNKASLDRLAQNRADLMGELMRAQMAPEMSTLDRYFEVSPQGFASEIKSPTFPVFRADTEGEISHFNRPEWERELAAQEGVINDKIAAMNRLEEIQGQFRQVATPFGYRMSEKGAMRLAANEDVIYNPVLGRTINVVHGAIGASAPHSINIADTRLGMDDLQASLRKAPWVDQATKTDILSRYASASSRGERAIIVQDAERKLAKATAERQGLDPDIADQLITASIDARGKWRTMLHGRAFSGTTPVVTGVGPDGVGFAFDRPFLQSQLQDSATLMDPKAMNAAMKFAKKHDLDELLAGTAKKGVDDGLSDIASSLLAAYMRIWKFSALFRFAYLPRVQFDSQLRNLAAMGALHYAVTAGEGTANFLKNMAPTRFEGNIVRRGASPNRASILRGGGGRGLPEAAIPARNYDEYLKADRLLGQGGNTLTNLMVDKTAQEYQRLAGSGDWRIVRPGEAEWGGAYQRAVNQQIRNSTAARAILDGLDEEAFVRLATRKAGPLRDEWKNFEKYPEFGGDAHLWHNSIKQHIDHMFPPEVANLREAARTRSLSAKEINSVFGKGGVARQMDVHGEAYLKYGKPAAFIDAFNKVQEKWYKWMSDVPEQVMARHPLYNHEFRRQMKLSLDNWAAEHPDELMPSEVTETLRRGADNLARKRVQEVMFDVSSMSSGGHSKNILFPFFSAWEDTMKKWGALMYDDPSLIRRAQQAFNMPANSGLMHNDEKSKHDYLRRTLGREPTEQEVADLGDQFIYLPQSFAKAMGIPDFGFKVDPKSFNIIFQGDPPLLPGVGPLVQVAANSLILSDPYLAKAVDTNPVLKYILPFGADPETKNPIKGLINSVIPGYAKSLMNAAGNGPQYADTFNQIRNSEFSRYYRGDRKDAPTAEEISKKTRNFFLAKAVMQNAAPVLVRPGPNEELQFYIDAFHGIQREWRASHPDGQRLGPDDPSAEEIAYERYPGFFDLSISLSENKSGLDASLEAQTAAEKYKKAISNDPTIAWALAGVDNLKGEFSNGVYDYQRANTVGAGTDVTFRGKKDPRENFYESSIRRGWMDYYKMQSGIQEIMASRGLKSMGAKGAKDLRQALATYRTQLAQQYPGWGEDYDQRDSSKVEGFIASVQSAWKDYPDLKNRSDMRALQDYIDGRAVIRQVLKGRPKSSLASNPDIADAWGSYVEALKNSDLAFSYMYSRILEGDDLNKELLGVGD